MPTPRVNPRVQGELKASCDYCSTTCFENLVLALMWPFDVAPASKSTPPCIGIKDAVEEPCFKPVACNASGVKHSPPQACRPVLLWVGDKTVTDHTR